MYIQLISSPGVILTYITRVCLSRRVSIRCLMFASKTYGRVTEELVVCIKISFRYLKYK